MNIPLGRLLKIDMGESKWGRVIYIVARPPIICPECNEIIHDWFYDENNYLICPYCETLIEKEIYAPCPYCNDNDLIRLRVVQNNNWGIDNDGKVYELNDKVYFGLTICKKSLEKDIISGKIKLLSAKETVDCKRMIDWTNSDDYEPGKEIPQSIKDKWKSEDQQ